MRIFTAALAALFVVLVIGSASAEPRVWVGLEKTFTKPGYADWRLEAYQDKITENVVITRADRKGVFNIAQEPGYKPGPPAGTEWAYGTASNWKNLRFYSFETWNSRVPPDAVGQDAVLHLLEEDVYLDIKFLSWSEGDGSGTGSGGGFSYVRATEGVPGEKVWTGSTITFTKADYADWTVMANQDRITSTVWITRRDKEGIFNIAQEREYRVNPPSGTQWAFGTAANWAALTFQPLAKLNGDDPTTMVGKDAVMHLLDEDVYVDVKFLTWVSYADGGSFSYQRATEGTEGEKVWTGSKIVFTRDSWADWTTAESQDRITGNVWITRGRWGGIFNIASEEGYEPYPPSGTEWAFGSADDWESLVFVSWEALAAQTRPDGKKDPRTLIDKPIVVHLIEEDIYLDMMIDSWDADDTGGGVSWRRAENDPVTIVDGPLALPSLVPLDNAYVSFRISVRDDDNEPIHVDWDFGDGTTGSGTLTSHTYTAAGDYTATVTVTDGTDVLIRTVGVKVNTRPRIVTGPTASLRYCQVGETVDFGATVTDDDGNALTSSWDFGDGEEASGTTAGHAFTASGDYLVTFATTDGMHGTDATVEVTVAKPLIVDKVVGKVNYRKESKDWLKLKTTIELPVGFLPEGKVLIATFGGVETEFLLDRRGRGRSILGAAKLKFRKKLGLWKCQVKLRRGNFAALWADHGVVNETVKDLPLTFPALLQVDAAAFQTNAPTLYRARETKTGRFKTPRQTK